MKPQTNKKKENRMLDFPSKPISPIPIHTRDTHHNHICITKTKVDLRPARDGLWESAIESATEKRRFKPVGHNRAPIALKLAPPSRLSPANITPNVIIKYLQREVFGQKSNVAHPDWKFRISLREPDNRSRRAWKDPVRETTSRGTKRGESECVRERGEAGLEIARGRLAGFYKRSCSCIF